MVNKNEGIVSPKGKLAWVSIAGVGKLKYNTVDEHEFVGHVVLPKAEALPFIKQIKDHYELHTNGKLKCKSLGYKPCDENGAVKDAAEVEFTDANCTHYTFRFHTSTTYTDGKPVIIKTYGANKKPVNLGGRFIGNGSVGRLSGQMGYWSRAAEDGVSLYLGAVQIVEFVEFSKDPGFEEDDREGGFTGFDDAEGGDTFDEGGAAGSNTANPKL